MSDETPKIGAAEFSAYADAKNLRFDECPSCHVKNPPLLVHETENASLGLAYARERLILSGALELLTLECENCGFLFLYNRRSVAMKIKLG